MKRAFKSDFTDFLEFFWFWEMFVSWSSSFLMVMNWKPCDVNETVLNVQLLHKVFLQVAVHPSHLGSLFGICGRKDFP